MPITEPQRFPIPPQRVPVPPKRNPLPNPIPNPTPGPFDLTKKPKPPGPNDPQIDFNG